MPVVRRMAQEAVAPSATMRFGSPHKFGIKAIELGFELRLPRYLPGVKRWAVSATASRAGPHSILNVVGGLGLEVQDVRNETVVTNDSHCRKPGR